MKFIFLPVPIAVLLLLLFILVLLPGCYTLQQGAYLFSYLGSAKPINKLHDNAGGLEKTFAENVSDIRSFAMNELGLSKSKNYTKYVKLDRDYLAAVVSAAAKDSFTKYQWNYPVVGTMPYKGFFNVEDAKKEARKLAKKNLDVWIRTVDAFSTLGFFRDPLYSYMTNYSVYALSDLLIHELTHSTIFIKNNVDFNEELAEFIGSEGARLFIEKRFGAGSNEYNDISISKENSRVYINFLQKLIAELDAMYNDTTLSYEQKLENKTMIIADYKKTFADDYNDMFTNDNYKGFITMEINNAYLELYRLYYSPENYFEKLYEKYECDLPTFINAAKNLKKVKSKDKQTLLDELEKLLKKEVRN